MRDFIYYEMMIHVPMCTAKEPKNILIVSDDPSPLTTQAAKHSDVSTQAIECSLEAISSLDSDLYDIVISQIAIDTLFLAQVDRILKSDGILVTTHPSLEDTEPNKKLMHSLARYFKIIMPYSIGNGSTLLLASKEYHPTADINLQRADMLDGLRYYNCDVHIAAFAMGNYIRKEYLGVIKN